MARGFRRKPFRRPVNRNTQARLNANPVLKKAHNHFEAGEYMEAAEIFEQAAREIHSRNGVIPPQIILQAGRARILGGQVDVGLNLIKRALQRLARRKQFPRAYAQIQMSFDLLAGHGYDKEAADFRAWADEYFPGINKKRRPGDYKQPPVGVLPSVCSACGGRMHPQEVDWLNDRQVECAYCGSIHQVNV